jgi:hypothetical protein
MKILTTLKHEAREVGLVTLYFLLWFGFILTLKKLLLATYDIEFYAFSSAVVGHSSSERSSSCWIKQEPAPGLTATIRLVRPLCTRR